MASYHFTIKTSSDRQGREKPRADLRSDYICREGKYAEGDKAEELIYKAHGNMPEWAKDNPRRFWSASEKYETLAGRTSFREIEFALPNEFSFEHHKELVQRFIDKHLGPDFVYTYAIHEKSAALAWGVQNPHVHIMFCERKLDGIQRDAQTFFSRANKLKPELGGPPKDARWNGNERSGYLRYMREDFAKMQNEILAREGFVARVDHRKKTEQYLAAMSRGDFDAAQLLDAPAEKHLGPKMASAVARDLRTLTAGVTDPEQRNKIRAKYWQSRAEANMLKVQFLHESRNLKQLTASNMASKVNERRKTRSAHSFTIAEKMYWIKLKREYTLLQNRLKLEAFRLERAAKERGHDPKLPYWRKHYDRRVAELAAMKEKLQNRTMDDATIKEIETMKDGMLKAQGLSESYEKEQSPKAILKEMYPDYSLGELRQIAVVRLPDLIKEIKAAKLERKKVLKKIRSEMNAKAIAEWRSSKGLLASIRRDEKLLFDERKLYKFEKKRFDEKPVPDQNLEPEAYKEHMQAAENLKTWKTEINDLADSIKARRAGWNVEKEKPEIRNQIQGIVDKFMARNMEIKKQADSIGEKIDRLYQERSEWRRLLYSLNRPGEAGLFLRGSINGQMQKAVRKLREERGKGRLSGLKLYQKDELDQDKSAE